MRRKEWRDMKKIFTVTFRSQMRSKKYRTALILVCILLFAVPLLVMAAAGRTGDSPDPAAQPEAVNPVTGEVSSLWVMPATTKERCQLKVVYAAHTEVTMMPTTQVYSATFVANMPV